MMRYFKISRRDDSSLMIHVQVRSRDITTKNCAQPPEPEQDFIAPNNSEDMQNQIKIIEMDEIPPPIDELSYCSGSSEEKERDAKSLAVLLGVESHEAKMHSSRPVVVGHRGLVYEEMENTLPAFQKAADIGCDAVELDVFLLLCGTLIVFHGGGPENLGALDESCGQSGNIMDLNYEQVKQLKMNVDNPEFVCPRDKVEDAVIPTLEEVLVFAKERGLRISLELKGPDTSDPVLNLVEEFDMVDQITFSSFDLERIARIRELRPHIDPATQTHVYKTAALFEDVPDDLLQVVMRAGASEVHLRYDTCTRSRIDAIHALGMSTLAWLKSPPLMEHDCAVNYLDIGNEDERLFQTIMNSGVRSICTNRPDVLIRHLMSSC